MNRRIEEVKRRKLIEKKAPATQEGSLKWVTTEALWVFLYTKMITLEATLGQAKANLSGRSIAAILI